MLESGIPQEVLRAAPMWMQQDRAVISQQAQATGESRFTQHLGLYDGFLMARHSLAQFLSTDPGYQEEVANFFADYGGTRDEVLSDPTAVFDAQEQGLYGVVEEAIGQDLLRNGASSRFADSGVRYNTLFRVYMEGQKTAGYGEHPEYDHLVVDATNTVFQLANQVYGVEW